MVMYGTSICEVVWLGGDCFWWNYFKVCLTLFFVFDWCLEGKAKTTFVRDLFLEDFGFSCCNPFGASG